MIPQGNFGEEWNFTFIPVYCTRNRFRLVDPHPRLMHFSNENGKFGDECESNVILFANCPIPKTELKQRDNYPACRRGENTTLGLQMVMGHCRI
ncbi:hypothetical protein CEXT_788381 [Caerostris extrusa]|uniref:Uncharacterized protein n=1 Tax=Caerostris extrusa TaxID=172846 RepID=A0AAV4WYK4_CAEEX|nr:hypothetical protein CEXT_788381 [Caerostris extrusa]